MRTMLKLCVVLPPDASELTGQDEGDENEVNTGILFAIGYHSHTCERDYRLDAEDLGLVKNDMLRNRFQKFKSYLYFVYNGTVSQPAQD
ncbi:hypothetical protein TNCV_675171 [Trichonephila clavipes]|nr:hypothetical protein TNCV_675171 [Trichonephila clavipes]